MCRWVLIVSEPPSVPGADLDERISMSRYFVVEPRFDPDALDEGGLVELRLHGNVLSFWVDIYDLSPTDEVRDAHFYRGGAPENGDMLFTLFGSPVQPVRMFGPPFLEGRCRGGCTGRREVGSSYQYVVELPAASVTLTLRASGSPTIENEVERRSGSVILTGSPRTRSIFHILSWLLGPGGSVITVGWLLTESYSYEVTSSTGFESVITWAIPSVRIPRAPSLPQVEPAPTTGRGVLFDLPLLTIVAPVGRVTTSTSGSKTSFPATIGR